MNKRTRILAMTAVLFLTSAVFAGSEQSSQAAPVAPPEQAQPTPATTDPSYIIGPEDILQVNVWKEPELTQSVPVRPDGKISLPLLNDVQAAGFTPMELTSRLTTALKQYLEDPRVTVTVTTVNSRRVFILGQVTHPGAFSLLSDMTVFQALSAAGGISEYAKATKIYVLRNENGKRVRLPFNYKEALRGQKHEQNFLLKPGDTIVVP